jgi:hypothetical protein
MKCPVFIHKNKTLLCKITYTSMQVLQRKAQRNVNNKE